MHKMQHPLYATWNSMLSRCYTKNHTNYKYYGGRGIKVCPEWRYNFWQFVKDVGERPKGCTLDRRDNNGDYTPENCRWATKKEQTNNSTQMDGARMCINGVWYRSTAEAARTVGRAQSTLHEKIKRYKTNMFNFVEGKWEAIYECSN